MAGKFGSVLCLAVPALLVGGILLSGCQRPEGKAGDSRQSLMVKGSDTMVHLVSDWAEAFMKAHPGAEISVTGGGSGTGIAALLNGTADICAASRSMQPDEYSIAGQRGLQPVETVVARDGIAVVVNPSNLLGELSLEQLEKIFTGAYTNWKQLGGPDLDIIVFSRESSSGTYVFFQEHVLHKKDYTQSARLMPATSSIIQSTAEDKGAIGYVGLGYALEAGDRVKVLAVRAEANSAVSVPSEATVISGDYPIARPLYLYTGGQPGGTAKQFIDFCLSAAGQQIVRQAGYITVK